jgi:hypothetical protein
MQKELSMDHMQSKRHPACVFQFHVNTDQPWNALRGNGFTVKVTEVACAVCLVDYLELILRIGGEGEDGGLSSKGLRAALRCRNKQPKEGILRHSSKIDQD